MTEITGIYLWLLYFSSGVGGLTILYLFYKTIKHFIFGKKRKNFESLRKEIEEGYAGLKRASKSFHTFNNMLNEIQDGK